MDTWSNLGGDLINGDEFKSTMPAGSGGGGGGGGPSGHAPEAFMTPAMQERYARFLAQREQGGEPLPPIPENMRDAVASGQAIGPQAPPTGEGTYRTTWGPTEDPFTAFGLNAEYVPPQPEMSNAMIASIIGGTSPTGTRPTPPPGAADGFYEAIMEMAASGRPPIPPATINGKPNPAYQEYLEPIDQARSRTAPPPETLTNAMIAQIIGGSNAATEPQRGIWGGSAPPTVKTGERAQPSRAEQAMAETTYGEGTLSNQIGDEARRSELRTSALRNKKDWQRAFQGWLDEKNALYNEDYGRSGYRAYALQQAGITPTMAQIAARQLVPQAMGIFSQGELQR
jgi:hypothetical protein